MVKQLTILLFCPLLSIGQDSTYAWGANPSADRVYHQSLILQNARFDFYENLRLWVDLNGVKEIRAKVGMSKKNFTTRLKNETFSPNQIKTIMQGFVKLYAPNMYGHDLSKEPEHELGKIDDSQ